MLYMHILGKLEMFIRFPAAFLGFTKSLLLMNASDCLPDLLPAYASDQNQKILGLIEKKAKGVDS